MSDKRGWYSRRTRPRTWRDWGHWLHWLRYHSALARWLRGL